MLSIVRFIWHIALAHQIRPPFHRGFYVYQPPCMVAWFNPGTSSIFTFVYKHFLSICDVWSRDYRLKKIHKNRLYRMNAKNWACAYQPIVEFHRIVYRSCSCIPLQDGAVADESTSGSIYDYLQAFAVWHFTSLKICLALCRREAFHLHYLMFSHANISVLLFHGQWLILHGGMFHVWWWI